MSHVMPLPVEAAEPARRRGLALRHALMDGALTTAQRGALSGLLLLLADAAPHRAIATDRSGAFVRVWRLVLADYGRVLATVPDAAPVPVVEQDARTLGRDGLPFDLVTDVADVLDRYGFRPPEGVSQDRAIGWALTELEALVRVYRAGPAA